MFWDVIKFPLPKRVADDTGGGIYPRDALQANRIVALLSKLFNQAERWAFGRMVRTAHPDMSSSAMETAALPVDRERGRLGAALAAAEEEYPIAVAALRLRVEGLAPSCGANQDAHIRSRASMQPISARGR